MFLLLISILQYKYNNNVKWSQGYYIGRDLYRVYLCMNFLVKTEKAYIKKYKIDYMLI